LLDAGVQMAYHQRDAYRVSMLAQAAKNCPWQLPTKIRAEVTQQEALGLAMLGEPMSAVERKIDEAHCLLADAPPDDEDGPLGAYFTAETLKLRCAASYTEAGRPGQAAALFGKISSSGTLSRRDAGFFSARRATALALSGEPNEAAAVALAGGEREPSNRRWAEPGVHSEHGCGGVFWGALDDGAPVFLLVAPDCVGCSVEPGPGCHWAAVPGHAGCRPGPAR